MRVQLMVQADALIELEMSDEDVTALEALDWDDYHRLDDLQGVDIMHALEQLDAEVTDFNVVRPKKATP